MAEVDKPKDETKEAQDKKPADASTSLTHEAWNEISRLATAAENTAEIGGKERHPGKERNLLEVKMTNAAQVEWQPECESPPRRIRKEAG